MDRYVSMMDPAYPEGSIAAQESDRLDVAVKQSDGVTNAHDCQWREYVLFDAWEWVVMNSLWMFFIPRQEPSFTIC